MTGHKLIISTRQAGIYSSIELFLVATHRGNVMHISNAELNSIRKISNVAAEISSETEFRKEIVGRTAALFGATTAAFLHWADSGNEPENLRQKDIYFYQLDQKFRDLYFDKVRSADPISRWLSSGRKFNIPPVSVLSKIISPQILKSSPLYSYILRPQDLHDVLTIAFILDRVLIGNISLARPRDAPHFGHGEMQMAQLLAPMLSTAYANILLTRKSERQESIIDELSSYHFDRIDMRPISMGDDYGLTRRELQVVEQVKLGLNSTEIGQQLSISRWTVKNHLQSIYEKVGVHNRIALSNLIQ